jgi:hypothetical protein
MDIINTINLFSREDRLLGFCNEAKAQGFGFKLWEGVQGNLTPAQNINESHRRIIQDAKDNGYEKCFVCEDDCRFSSPSAWKYYLSQMPDSWDLYFSMLYSGEIKDNRIINGFSGMTLYCCHSRFYDFFLSMPPHVHCDRWLGMAAHEKEYYVCNPFVARQCGGMSNNMNQVMNYSVFEEQMDFYNG